MAKANRTSPSERVRWLVSLLGGPEKGELTYDGKERPLSRLGALRELKRLEEVGAISPPQMPCGVNLHIHTNESFGVFDSPAQVAWEGYKAGLEVLGINDHYTTNGHREFREACRILGLRATFNLEIMALDMEAKKKGEKVNDPKNAGRTYLCGKGVVRELRPSSSSDKLLKTVRSSFRKRCEEMTRKVSVILNDLDTSMRLGFDEVLRFTPRGNVTERHIAQALAGLAKRRFSDETERKRFLAKMFGGFDEGDLSRENRFQDLIKNALLKAGGPAYVEEPPEAFPSVEEAVQLFRDYGAIPTYPVLGNPVTERERNLDSLFYELEDHGIFAIEVIPKRNTRARLQEILEAAEKHGFPVFTGTEHNTKAPEPLLDKFSRDPSFLPTFRRGAYLVLGHQFLSGYAGKGYLRKDGRLMIENRNEGERFFSFAGALTWHEKALKWLRSTGKENVFKVVLGVYTLFGQNGLRELEVGPDFEVPSALLAKIHAEGCSVQFADDEARSDFETMSRRCIA